METPFILATAAQGADTSSVMRRSMTPSIAVVVIPTRVSAAG